MDGLKALAELAELEGVAAAQVEDIRSGRNLVDLELRQAMGSTLPPVLAPAFRIGQDGLLLGALFPVTGPACPGPGNSYNAWLARQEKRRVTE